MKILSRILVVAVVVTLGTAFSSCKKECVECTGSGADTTLCEEDFGSGILYNAAIDAYEIGGGTCTAK